MKKIINTAAPVVVSTIRTPLNGSLSLSSNGGSLTQVYDEIFNTYEPDDRSVTPLVLSPIISVVDPDTGQQVPLSSLSSLQIKWFIGNSTTPVSSTTPSDDYHLQTDDDKATGTPTGSLVVRHNVGPNDGFLVNIMCEVSFTDSGRSEAYKYNAAVILTTEQKVQDQLSIQLENPSKVTFNPISEDSSQKTFKAKVYNGGTVMAASNFKFFWYVDGVLADTKVCYVSGQNSDTLVLDAEYADNVVVSVRIATDTTAQNPNHPVTAECTLIWNWPRMRVIPFSQSGEAIMVASQQKSFGSIIQAYGKDISTAKRNRYCKLKWYVQASNSSVKNYLSSPWGFEKTIAGSELFRTGGVQVNVGATLYAVGAKSAVGGAGAEVEIASTDRPVVITTKRTPLEGSLFITSSGGSLTQVYDEVFNTYEPDDRQLTPLVLQRVASITDPDTGLPVPLSDLSSVETRWYVGNSQNYITSRTPSDDYHLQTDDDTATGNLTGNLVVRHNVGPADEFIVPIMLELICTDNGRAETYRFYASTSLTTEQKVQDQLSVQLGNPSKVTYDPIAEDDSQRVFTAKVYNGGTLMDASSFKFFWYVADELVDDETLGYVSGQGTDTLTIDAEYFDNVIVRVGISTDINGDAPNHPANAECTLVWSWPRMQALPYSMNGGAIKLASDKKRFGAFVQAYSKDIPDAKRARYCRLNFFTKATNSAVRKDQGWGNEVEVDGADLYHNGNVNTNVGVDLYTIGQLKAVTDPTTGAVVIDEATGKVVVCGD